jgi:hypothetical protein
MGRTRYGPKAGPSPHFAPLCLIGPSHTHVYANCGDTPYVFMQIAETVRDQ